MMDATPRARGGSVDWSDSEDIVDPETLRHAMRRWGSGVTIVSSLAAGVQHGMTVSSFTSVSLTPPLVLVSLEQATRTYRLVKQSGIFGVCILADHQQEISDRFAGRQTEDTDRFEGLETFTLNTGAPFLTGSLACLDCRVVTSFEAGNHTLFIGEVLAVKIGKAAHPLLYFNRSYRRLVR
jgi:flavin reductase (DIM6/NTAB) family NADH-FMN oxidoreductase RutF